MPQRDTSRTRRRTKPLSWTRAECRALLEALEGVELSEDADPRVARAFRSAMDKLRLATKD